MSYLGTEQVGKMFLGSEEIAKAYRGSELVYQKDSGSIYDAEIEYLENTDAQYIDTGIVPDADTGVYAHLIATGGGDHYAIGLRDTSGDTRWCIGRSGDWYAGYGIWYPGGIATSEADAMLNWLNDGKFYTELNGTTATLNLSALPFTPVNQIRLFGTSGMTGSTYTWTGKITFCKISQGSDIIMDLIPVRKGQVGYMYDRISGQLFGNAGSGSFTLGNDL